MYDLFEAVVNETGASDALAEKAFYTLINWVDRSLCFKPAVDLLGKKRPKVADRISRTFWIHPGSPATWPALAA